MCQGSGAPHFHAAQPGSCLRCMDSAGYIFFIQSVKTNETAVMVRLIKVFAGPMSKGTFSCDMALSNYEILQNIFILHDEIL